MANKKDYIRLEYIYHDGVYRLTKSIMLQNHIVYKDFSWNGITGAIWTSKKMLPATLLHDYLLYAKKVSRAKADELFLKQMLKDGNAKLKSYFYYGVVRGYAKITKEE